MVAAMSWRRWVELACIGLLVLVGALQVATIIGDWGGQDVEAYWQAALRLRAGEPLYGGVTDPDSYRVFRYAPWFAVMWVPLTYLPREVVNVAWAASLAVASLAVLWGLLRLRSGAAYALAAVVAPMLLSLVQVGNIQPLVLAMLGFGISRGSGPLWIGIAASLKAVPFLYTAVYAARREWRRLAWSALLTAVLVGPMLLLGAGYTTDPGASVSLWYYVGPWAWAIGAVASLGATAYLAWRRSDYVWVAASIAVILVAPRGHQTYATFLVIGLLNGARDRI